MAAAEFDAATGRIAGAARALAARGVDAIAMLGTSLSFFRGPDFNRQLEAAMRAASGVPCVTATSAVIGALRPARRLAVGTAYDDEMNARLRQYLEKEDFNAPNILGMNIRKVREAMSVADDAIVALAAAFALTQA